MIIHYSFGDSIFGSTFLAMSEGKLLSLGFVEAQTEKSELQKLKKKWPEAQLVRKTSDWARGYLDSLLPQKTASQRPLRFELFEQGSEFQRKVWKALTEIPPGKTCYYSEIANRIGQPQAVRAVGTAIAANPIAYLIPCHRVLPKAGGVGQFAWGPDLKKKMLQFEQALSD